MGVKVGDKVRSLVTEFDVREGGIYEVAAVFGDSINVYDDVGDDYRLMPREYEPVAVAGSNGNRFKVGDRVRVVRLGAEDGGSFHSAKIGDEFTVTKIYDEPEAEIHTNVWYFYPHEIEPVDAPLTIREGKIYRTRDGRKVGPMERSDHSWTDVRGRKSAFNCGTGGDYDATGIWLTSDGDSPKDIIAEWTDERAMTNADIFNELEDWMADNPLSPGYAPTPTTGFTVPLDAPEFGGAESKFKVGDRVHYKDAYCEGTGVIHSDNDAKNGLGWFVTVEEKDGDHAPFDDNTTRIFTEDKLRLVAEATTAQEPRFVAADFYPDEPPTSIADIVRRLERLESAMWQRAA